MSGPQNPYLISKPRFMAPTSGNDAFYNDREDTVLVSLGSHRVTLTTADAWDFLGRLEVALHGADYDRKDD